ncbi:MAG: hypothetical protein MZU97_09750 [Bacillus subtilis]|nr:hypothetical protein [Bacillus subtilis]
MRSGISGCSARRRSTSAPPPRSSPQDDGVIPNDQDYLERLPGVGRKTANVFLSEWYHVPRIAVDTHVGRVSYRLGFAPKGDDPVRTERRLMAVFPAERWSDLHHKLIFFGRYFCTARKPSCARCPFLGFCVEPKL